MGHRHSPSLSWQCLTIAALASGYRAAQHSAACRAVRRRKFLSKPVSTFLPHALASRRMDAPSPSPPAAAAAERGARDAGAPARVTPMMEQYIEIKAANPD
jgi:hypothetical protein